MDFQQKLKFIKYNFEIGGYRIVAKECVGLIEQALRQLFREQLPRLDEDDQIVARKTERKMSRGNTMGVERFTMGQLVRLIRNSHFLDAWERASGKDLGNIRVINLDELTKLRNRLIHDNREATRSEAEFLVNCLRVILETFELGRFETAEEPLTPFTHPSPLPGGESLPITSSQQVAAPRKQRDRRIMLDRVKRFWIEGVLEKSLHNVVLLDVEKLEKPEALDHSWDMMPEPPEHPNRPIPPGKRIIENFDEMGRALLILGAPGSGKTVTLLELARDAIARAEHDPTLPVPVVFNLSAWTGNKQRLVNWMVAELNLKYQIPKKVGKQWIENDALLLLLDGLDEVQPEHRTVCVNAINQFRQDYGLNEIVVCCRSQEYEALATRLKLEGAIVLQPLTMEQIDACLAAAGSELAALRTVIQDDDTLQKLAESPLLLHIMTRAYHGLLVEDVSSRDSIEERRNRLFDTYTERMLQHRGVSKRYTPQHTRDWLSWLARQLSQHSQTEFFIERIQPSWLETPTQRLFYHVEVRLIGGLGFVLAAVLSYVLAAMLCHTIVVIKALWAGGVSEALVTLRTAPFGVPDLKFIYIVYVGLMLGLAFEVASVLAMRLPVGLAVLLAAGTITVLASWYLRDGESWKWIGGGALGLISGLPGGLAGVSVADRDRIKIAEMLTWSWKKVIRGLAIGVILLTCGLALRLASGQSGILLTDVLGAGLPIIMALILVSGLIRSEVIEMRTVPNEGIRRSARNAIQVGFAILLVSMLCSIAFVSLNPKDTLTEGLTAGLILGLLIGIVAGLSLGGSACIQHAVLYRLLVRNGHIPRNLVNFLDYAAERIFLRKVGGGYIFVHRMLLEYFARQRSLT